MPAILRVAMVLAPAAIIMEMIELTWNTTVQPRMAEVLPSLVTIVSLVLVVLYSLKERD
jgi:hypothetical protein